MRWYDACCQGGMRNLRLAPLGFTFTSLMLAGAVVSACSSTSASHDDAGVADASTHDANDGLDATTDGTSADAGTSVTSKCERLFAAALAMAQRCGPPPGTEPSAIPYHPSEKASYVGTCVSQASAHGYDPSRLDACLAEAETTKLCVDTLELAASTNPNFSVGIGSTLASCMQQPGTLAAGAGCAYGSQCASAKCVASGPQPAGEPLYCGTCAAPSGTTPAPVALGSACDSNSTCVSGAYCEGTCKMPPGNGESCLARCASGFGCSGSDPSTRVCTPRAPLNGSCANYVYCQSPLTCANNTCVQGPLGHAGDDCSFGASIDTLCTDDTFCTGDAVVPSKRSCVSIQTTRGQIGEACSPTGNKPCAPSLWCYQSTCQVRDSALCKDAPDAGTDAGASDAATDASFDASAD